MTKLINGFSVRIKTTIRGNRLTAKVTVPELDSMVVRVSGPTITGTVSNEDRDLFVNRVVAKIKDEFRHMAAMAIGHNEHVS